MKGHSLCSSIQALEEIDLPPMQPRCIITELPIDKVAPIVDWPNKQPDGYTLDWPNKQPDGSIPTKSIKASQPLPSFCSEKLPPTSPTMTKQRQLLWGDIGDDTSNDFLLGSPPTFDEAAEDIIDQMEKWHLLEEFTSPRSSGPTPEEKNKKEVIMEVKIDLEEVSRTLQKLMHSSMLLYFIERAPPVISIKNWATKEFQ